MRHVLLIGDSDDEDTNAIQSELNKCKMTHVRISSEDIANGLTALSFWDDGTGTIRTKDATLALSDVSAVWLGDLHKPKLTLTEPSVRNFAETELIALVGQLAGRIARDLWVVHPEDRVRMGRKAVQLPLAREAGFAVPATCMTTSALDASAFLSEHPDSVYKTIEHSFFSTDYEHAHVGVVESIPTSKVGTRTAEVVAMIVKSGGILQERVETMYEVRVTCVGETLFAAQIKSESVNDTVSDWKHGTRMALEAHTLPDSVASQCLAYMRLSGLSFGAFDLGVLKNGSYVFFEMNPDGSWVWVENATHQPIAETITHFMCSK